MQALTPELQMLLTQLSQHLQCAEKPSELNLLLLWQRYKVAKAQLVAPTTQKGDWSEVDRALNFVPPECLEFTASSTSLLLAELLKRYAASTARKVLLYARAANCWAIEEELRHPSVDSLRIREMKLQKLRLKEQMEGLRGARAQ